MNLTLSFLRFQSSLTLALLACSYSAHSQVINIDTTPSNSQAYELPKYGGNLTYLDGGNGTVDAVSYTHLTLPTKA